MGTSAKPTIYEDEFSELEATSLQRMPVGIRLLCCEIADEAEISEWQALLVMLLVRSLSQASAGTES